MLGGNGYIYSQRNEPVENVLVMIYHDNEVIDSTYSDSTGFFRGVRFEKCFFCPSVKYTFKKDKYKTTTLDIGEYMRNQRDSRQPKWDSLVVVLTE